MKNSRLFEILYLLVERRAVTAGELARQDEIPFALQAILATGSESEGETLARLTALFRREGTDWLEVDFTDWGSGAWELCFGKEDCPGPAAPVVHLLQFRRGEKPPDGGARPAGVQGRVLVSIGLSQNSFISIKSQRLTQ